LFSLQEEGEGGTLEKGVLSVAVFSVSIERKRKKKKKMPRSNSRSGILPYLQGRERKRKFERGGGAMAARSPNLSRKKKEMSFLRSLREGKG